MQALNQAATPAFSPRFLACLPFTLIQECPHPDNWSSHTNFSDDPGDTGGQTMCGITHSEYNVFRIRNHLAPRPVILLTKDEGYEIYWESYWQPYCPKLPAGLDLAFFDDSVNMGMVEAIKILQFVVGTVPDGHWGPETQKAVDAATVPANVAATIKAYTAHRAAVYRTFSAFGRFGKDWIRRDAEIGAEAVKMAIAAAPPASPAPAAA